MLLSHSSKPPCASSTSITSLLAFLTIRRSYVGQDLSVSPTGKSPPTKWEKTVLEHDKDTRKALRQGTIPPYPHGPRRFYKQADKGLYGGATVQFGNKISQGKSESKSRRRYDVNIRREKLWSDALDKWLMLRVTHRCMRTIRKCGGLDAYLLGDKPGRIKELGLLGWKLRWLVLNTPSMKQRLHEERKKLGLKEPPATFEEVMESDAFKDIRDEIFAEQEAHWQRLSEQDQSFKSHVLLRWTKDYRKYHVKDMVPAWEPPSLNAPEV